MESLGCDQLGFEGVATYKMNEDKETHSPDNRHVELIDLPVICAD